MTLYDRIKFLCEQAGFTISSLPEKIPSAGLSVSGISSWKVRNSTPRPSAVKAIADYFGVSVDYILHGDEPKTAEELYKSDLLQAAREDAGKRILFDLLDGASEQDIREAIAIITAIRKTRGEN